MSTQFQILLEILRYCALIILILWSVVATKAKASKLRRLNKRQSTLSRIERAERRGVLKDDMTIIETTAGNAGLRLVLIATQTGYPLILVVPDMVSPEKISHYIRLTRSDVAKYAPEYYQNYAKRLAEETAESLHIDQLSNPGNRLAHTESNVTEL